jgi:hypothetical protein
MVRPVSADETEVVAVILTRGRWVAVPCHASFAQPGNLAASGAGFVPRTAGPAGAGCLGDSAASSPPPRPPGARKRAARKRAARKRAARKRAARKRAAALGPRWAVGRRSGAGARAVREGAGGEEHRPGMHGRPGAARPGRRPPETTPRRPKQRAPRRMRPGSRGLAAEAAGSSPKTPRAASETAGGRGAARLAPPRLCR